MASDWFFLLDGVAGDSAAEGHQGELDVSSWSWGMSASPSATGMATGRPVLSDLVLSIPSEFGGLQLVKQCSIGRTGEARLTGVRAGGNPFTYLRYEMPRATVTSVTQVTGEDGTLSHQVGLRFRGMKATFTRQNPDGTAGTTLQVDVGIGVA